MAVKVTITASKNGGNPATHDVFMRNTDPTFGPDFLARVYDVFAIDDGDAFAATTCTITAGVNDLVSGFVDHDFRRGITLAFID